MFKKLTALSLFCVASTSAIAAPVQWETSAGGNGHWYEMSTVPVMGQDAAAAAAGDVIVPGATSYLATISDAAEWAFMAATFAGYNFWISGSDEATEGTWLFTSGPEAGTVMSYLPWNSVGSTEPNGGTGENYLQVFGTGFYNDREGDDKTLLYLVEAEMPSVPLPATGLLLAGAVGAAGALRRRKA